MKKKGSAIDFCLAAGLLLFSLRHVTWGLDLWDTGYNYANYTYASPEHMGIMWWFSTYLTNLVGHVFTLLPFGDTLVGLNVYTGLLVGGISVLGYFFCRRRLGMTRTCAFAGEMIALCLCWCPSAKLYDYLTYLLFLLCVIFLYNGLTGRKKSLLVLAGVCLGTNIFVRFSNLPEAGLILAVWGYAFLEGLETRDKDGKAGQAGETGKAGMAEQAGETGKAWKTGQSWLGAALAGAGYYTLWCLVGYLIPLILGFGWIAVRYGIGEYAEGIRLLFSMTNTATDYQAGSMLYGLVWPFWEGKYWVVRILIFVLAASLFALTMDYAPLCLKQGKREQRIWAQRFFTGLGGVGSLGFTALLVYWLYSKEEPSFTSSHFKSYDPIYWPAVMLLVLAIGICLVQIFRRKSSRQEKLLAGLILLVIPLTSLGSNNGLYPSFNNLFLTAPYLLQEMSRFTRWAYRRASQKPKEWSDLRWNFIPAAFAGWAFLILIMIQFGMFGLRFAFCEGTGVQARGYEVLNNRVLRGVEMSYERAQWLSEISEFSAQNGLAGQEAIFYGMIPSLSFYLEMPAAFHAWADLKSYHYVTMMEAINELMAEIAVKGRAKPVVIAEKKYAPYGPLKVGELYGFEDSVENNTEETVLGNGDGDSLEAIDPKWWLIRLFMRQYGYEKTFENEKFVIWQAE